MSSGLTNLMRREAERAMSQTASVRIGIVSAYDPSNYAAKVRIQPDDVETGWMPIGSNMGGNGFGDFYGPMPGDVVYVHFQEGGKLAPFIGGFHFGDRFRPLSVPSGERWIVHRSGSFLKFHGDGTIEMNADTFNLTGDVNVTGNIVASGDISDLSNGSGTMAHIRTVYDSHVHGGVQTGGGNTATPTPTL